MINFTLDNWLKWIIYLKERDRERNDEKRVFEVTLMTIDCGEVKAKIKFKLIQRLPTINVENRKNVLLVCIKTYTKFF